MLCFYIPAQLIHENLINIAVYGILWKRSMKGTGH